MTIMGLEFRELGKWGKRGQLLSVFIVCSTVIFALSLYYFNIERNQNLIYTAVFLDDMAVNLQRSNYSYDAVAYSSALAYKFCDIYELETRTLDGRKYRPLCDVIKLRASLLIMCGDPESECPESRIIELEERMIEVEHLAKEVKESSPYYGIVLSYTGPEFKTDYGETIKIIS